MFTSDLFVEIQLGLVHDQNAEASFEKRVHFGNQEQVVGAEKDAGQSAVLFRNVDLTSQLREVSFIEEDPAQAVRHQKRLLSLLCRIILFLVFRMQGYDWSVDPVDGNRRSSGQVLAPTFWQRCTNLVGDTLKLVKYK